MARWLSSERSCGPAAGPLTFARLKAASFAHSCVYLALLVVAFAAGNPQPVTFVLGLSHGLLWIGMSLACLAAVRLRIVSAAARRRGRRARRHRAVLRQRRVRPRAAPRRRQRCRGAERRGPKRVPALADSAALE